MSQTATDQGNIGKIDAAIRAAEAEGDGEKLAIIKMMCAIGLIRNSKLPTDQISDFGSAAITAFRSAVEVAVLTNLMETHQKKGDPMDLVVAMRAVRVVSEDIKNQQRLATLTTMFDEPKEAAEGQANG